VHIAGAPGVNDVVEPRFQVERKSGIGWSDFRQSVAAAAESGLVELASATAAAPTIT
jgi:hypothetical protein